MVAIIKSLCDEKGINIFTLEKTLGIANGNIRRWDVSKPNIEKVAAVADYFGVTVDYLLKGEERPAQMDEPSPGERAVLNRLRQMPNSAQAQAAVLAFLQALEHQVSESDE